MRRGHGRWAHTVNRPQHAGKTGRGNGLILAQSFDHAELAGGDTLTTATARHVPGFPTYPIQRQGGTGRGRWNTRSGVSGRIVSTPYCGVWHSSKCTAKPQKSSRSCVDLWSRILDVYVQHSSCRRCAACTSKRRVSSKHYKTGKTFALWSQNISVV